MKQARAGSEGRECVLVSGGVSEWRVDPRLAFGVTVGGRAKLPSSHSSVAICEWGIRRHIRNSFVACRIG